MYEITVDGVTYNIATSIKREVEIRESDLSGMLLDRSYHRDIVGSYLQYTISLAIPRGSEQEYSQLFEVLSNPVESHTFILPYNQGDKQVEGMVNSISDEYYKATDNGQVVIWRKISFVITSKEPYKVPEDYSE